MARVELLSAANAPLLARPYYADGDPGPIAAALAQVPEMLEVTLPFVGTVLSPSSIGFRTKEIVILRTSAVLLCSYCVGAHTDVALSSGLSEAEVRALRGEMPLADAFIDAADLALLGWIDTVAGEKGPVPEPLAAALARFHPDHEVVELTLLIGATMLLNRFCTALALPVPACSLDRVEVAG
jgi:AhpD family alkylhydroperoxidase